MGMNFSPMYQPVSTKTIKADGDLNIDPYDLIAVDGKFDTVEADEFVGGVGNFSNTISSNFTYNGVLSTTQNGNAAIVINALSGSFTSTEVNTGANLGSLTYPKRIGVFKIGDISISDSLYLNFTYSVPDASSKSHTVSLLKNGVEYTTMTIRANTASTSVSVTINYGDDSVWGIKFKSGSASWTSGYK